MAIQNPNEVLKYLPFAIGTYGSAAGSPAFQVGTAMPVSLEKFKAQSAFFQSTLYQDPATGKYTIAIAGSNELGDGVVNASLATANMKLN